MKKLCIGMIMLFLSCCFMNIQVFAYSLDTHGQLCGEMHCRVDKFLVKSSTTEIITYTFEGICYWPNNYPEELACPPTKQVTVNAEWNKNTKVAYEKIFVPIGNQAQQIFEETSSKCPAGNPWLIPGIDCTVISGIAKPGVKYPRSATNVLTSSQQEALAKETSSANSQAFLTTPESPVIISPIQQQKYLIIPAAIAIEVKHNLAYGVAFEFQWKPFSKPNSPPGFFVDREIALANLTTKSGVTTAQAVIEKAGHWRMRSQSIFPNAPWSDWTNFDVNVPTKSQNLKPQIKLLN